MFSGSREIPECPLTIYKLQTLEADHKPRLEPVFRALQAKNNLKLYFRRPLERRCIFKAGSRGLCGAPRHLHPHRKKVEERPAQRGAGASSLVGKSSAGHLIKMIPEFYSAGISTVPEL